MKNLEAENARLMLIVKKLTDALNDAHFDVRSKADMIASLEHFKQEIPVLRQQLEDAVSGSCVCSVCQGMPEGAACALCAKKIPPPPPPHRTKKVFQSALLTKKPGKPSVTFGVAASAPGKYMGKSSKSNEADTQNQIDNYDPNWSATGDPREPTVEEMKKQVEYFQEQLDEAAGAIDSAIQEKDSALIRLQKVSTKAQRLTEMLGEQQMSADPVSPMGVSDLNAASAVTQELTDLRSQNALYMSALKDNGIEMPTRGERSSPAATVVAGNPGGGVGGIPSEEVSDDSPRTASLKRNSQMTMEALGYAQAPNWESMGIKRAGGQDFHPDSGLRFEDSPYHPNQESANSLTLNGYEKTKSGKMVYEVEMELQDTLRALHDNADTLDIREQQLGGLRTQLSEMHSTNKKLRNQMEAMLNSQSRVVSKATEVSSTMHLSDLKAFGAVLENRFGRLPPSPPTAKYKSNSASSTARPLNAPQLMQFNDAREELGALLAHPLQSRTKPEQEAIEDLLATYARVAVNSGAGGAIQVQQELDQYRALEHQMAAEAGLADGDFGAVFACLEKKAADAELTLAGEAKKIQQLEDGYARSRRELVKLKSGGSGAPTPASTAATPAAEEAPPLNLP